MPYWLNLATSNWVFLKIDKSGSHNYKSKNKFSHKVTSNRDWTWEPRTLVVHLLQSHAFLTEQSWQVLIGEYFTPLLFVHQLTFSQKSIENNYIGSLKSHSFMQWQLADMPVWTGTHLASHVNVNLWIDYCK